MSRILGGLVRDDDPGDPPDWCLQPGPGGQLATCTYYGGEWHRSYDEGLGSVDSGPPAGFAVLFVLVLAAGIAGAAWKVSTARRMARDAGMSERDAAAMTLLTDDGFESTYLAANLRGTRPAGSDAATAPAPGPSAAERLRELKALLDEGLISQEEHDSRRRAIVDEL